MSFVPTANEPGPDAVSEDAVLGGRLRLRQLRRGHRVGHDAILLAAATAARTGDRVVDLGAGVGGAGLAVAARVPGVDITLVELDPVLASLADENIHLNDPAGPARVVTLDVTGTAEGFAAAVLPPGAAACVLMNPPFNDPKRQNVSPEARRRAAHVASVDTLSGWIETAERLLRPGGVLTLIWRADALADVVGALRNGFGGIAILPVHPRPDRPAIRVIVHAVKASRAPLEIYPGLFLNDENGRPSAAAEAVLRGGEALVLATLG